MTAVDLPTSLGLGEIDQVSFVVHDLGASLPMYQALFGPFTTREAELSPELVTYRGKPAAGRVHLAFGTSGGIEIELIQPLSGDVPHFEHLRDHGEGLHHVRFQPGDLQHKQAAMEAAGFTAIWEGRTPPATFVYLEHPGLLGHTLVELLQRPARH